MGSIVRVVAVCCVLTFTLTYASAIVKPHRVQPGDTVGFISPASPPLDLYPKGYKEHVTKIMSALDLNVKFGANAFAVYGYLAGTDEQRASDVMAMFEDPSVKFIIANRGGYGCDRMIELLNYTVIAQNPKPIMGYSDVTALLNAIHIKTGLVTFHGPMGIDDWDNYNQIYAQQVIMDADMAVFEVQDGYNWTTITPGKASGKLVGGNLSVFTSIMGSQYFPPVESFVGAILFLEDVEEPPYQFDRCFAQLNLSGVFQVISGFVFGRCTNCDPNPPNPGSFTIEQVVNMYIKPLNIPAFQGGMFAHIAEQYTLPIGVQVEIDADAGTIAMLEPAVL